MRTCELHLEFTELVYATTALIRPSGLKSQPKFSVVVSCIRWLFFVLITDSTLSDWRYTVYHVDAMNIFFTNFSSRVIRHWAHTTLFDLPGFWPLTPPIVSVSSSCSPARMSNTCYLSAFGFFRLWRGPEGPSGLTSNSPCGLPQAAPRPAQQTKLLSPPHLLLEY